MAGVFRCELKDENLCSSTTVLIIICAAIVHYLHTIFQKTKPFSVAAHRVFFQKCWWGALTELLLKHIWVTGCQQIALLRFIFHSQLCAEIFEELESNLSSLAIIFIYSGCSHIR